MSSAGEPAEPKRSSMASYEYDIWTARFTGKRLSGVWSSLYLIPLTQFASASLHGRHMHGRIISKHLPDSRTYMQTKQSICAAGEAPPLLCWPLQLLDRYKAQQQASAAH